MRTVDRAARSSDGWLVLVPAVGAAGMLFLPLFQVIGYEFAVAQAVLLSVIAGPVARASVLREGGHIRDLGLGAFRRTAARLFLAAVLALAVHVAGLFWIPNCNLGVGLAFYGLLPGVTVLTASLWGALTAAVAQGGGMSLVAYYVGLVVAMVYSVGRMAVYPPIYTFDHFFGYFPGSLYDEALGVGQALVYFRAYSATVVLAVLAWMQTARAGGGGYLAVGQHTTRRGPRLALAVLFTALAVGLRYQGDTLGFARTTAGVVDALGGRAETAHFTIFYRPGSKTEKLLPLLQREYEFHLKEVAEFFGAAPPSHVDVFLYPSREEKRRLMGGSQTQIAKVWLNQIHIDENEFPARVARHEIAHVVAGVFGAEWTGLSGLAGGLYSYVGVIEGYAVAAAWDADPLNPHEWARMMLDLDVAPDLRAILSPLGFWAESSSRAYLYAGSFFRFLRDHRDFGPANLQRAYAAAEFDGLTKKKFEDYVGEWHTYLRSLELPAYAREIAESRLLAPSIFKKVCAHEVASLKKQARRALDQGEVEKGCGLYERALDLYRNDRQAEREYFEALVASGQMARAQVLGQTMTARAGAFGATKRLVAAKFADRAWQDGRDDEARGAYAGLLAGAGVPPTDLRLTAAKLGALEAGAAGAWLKPYLLGTGRDDRRFFWLWKFVEGAPGHPLGPYLLGRALYLAGDYANALLYHRDPFIGLLPEAFQIENARLAGFAAYYEHDYAAAREFFARGQALARHAGEAEDFARMVSRAQYAAEAVPAGVGARAQGEDPATATAAAVQEPGGVMQEPEEGAEP